jgi:dihydrodipicolinate synthase/N-acetylneuraminate lyase
MATTDLSGLLPESVSQVLRQGAVIPAHPLALNAQRQLDPRRQRALSRYYLDAGAGGLAVGVHTTQFAIRENGMYAPVLEMAMQTAQDWIPLGGSRPLVMIAGVAGPTSQACAEAATAKAMGYHAGLLSLAALRGANEADILAHCRAVAQVIPLVGFYLQPAVGGVVLSAAFWEAFARIEQVVAIKMAPFNRYRTLDVIHGVVAAQAEERITLYTGNDDHIVLDLVTPFHVKRGAETVQVRIRGGLLGHWSVWTQKAVEQLKRCQEEAALGQISAELLALDSKVTDCNSALFDVAHEFAGCIAGCHEVLRRQGLLDGIWCLDPREALSAGQAEELTRVSQAYPDLIDDKFVTRHLARWLDG